MKKASCFTFNGLLVLLLMLPLMDLSAQETGDSVPGKTIIARFTAADAENNYFEVDMSGLPDDYERATLLDFIFADNNLVVIKTDIGAGKLELCASLALDVKSALCRIDDFYRKAAGSGHDISPEQKQALMEKYLKYKSK